MLIQAPGISSLALAEKAKKKKKKKKEPAI